MRVLKNLLKKLSLASFLALLLIPAPSLPAQEEDTIEPSRMEIVKPRSYAIKRFSEIISDYENNQPSRLSDRLIRNRALLNVAKREKSSYLQKMTTEEKQPSEDRLKSFEAMIDHYEKKVAHLETRIKKK